MGIKEFLGSIGCLVLTSGFLLLFATFGVFVEEYPSVELSLFYPVLQDNSYMAEEPLALILVGVWAIPLLMSMLSLIVCKMWSFSRNVFIAIVVFGMYFAYIPIVSMFADVSNKEWVIYHPTELFSSVCALVAYISMALVMYNEYKQDRQVA